MGVDDRLLEAWHDMRRRRHGEGPPLNPPGGDGTSGGMEARVAALEAHMEHVREDLGKLGGLPKEVGELRVKAEALPTKEWTFKTLAAMLATLAVVVGLIVRFIPHAP